ncbi:MAG: heavy metal translocating P-type ATPase [Deltaproteobacteria bacterium]|nr:heavy metal translocating P-type ATPase [Deltaproteobacteria bacterium]MCB9787516.1 heavy metal translocating P-type ATPase [Deltaproteobacteria bacterium]
MTPKADTPHRVEHGGVSYPFCCAGCATKFAADPGRYLAPAEAPERAAPAAPPGTMWVCPMDPEVREPAPGSCPKCGMALEPETPTAEAPDDTELRDMTRRFWLGAAFTLPLLLVAMGDMLPGQPVSRVLPGGMRPWLELVLAVPVVFYAGWPLLVRAVRSVRTWNLNMFTLIGIGVAVAFVSSVVSVLAPGLIPEAFTNHGEAPLYFESAAVIVTLVLLGQVLELRARQRTGDALRALLELAPKTARRLGHEGVEEDVPLDRVAVGDRLRVRPGERVPVDGVIVAGRSQVDTAMVTGEPVPVAVEAGDEVIGGTVNGTGGFVMEAARVGSETLLARIVALVAKAQRSRAPVQALADRVAGWFVPAVVLAAIVAFGAWMLFGPEPRFGHALLSAISVLIVACPCALGLATPVSITVAMGRAAREGVLFRDARSIEVLRGVNTLVVDKTGTLTEGRPRVVSVEAAEGFEADEVLALAASLERASEHPLAAAVVAGAEERGLSARDAVEGFASTTGQGVAGVVGGRAVRVGSRAHLEAAGVEVGALSEAAEGLRREGHTAFRVSVDGRTAGLIAVADPIKASTRDTIRALHEQGLRIVMVTGDVEATARAVAQALGIDEVHAGVRPEGKSDIVERLQREGRVVAVAGDGVNDAPALARADVGIAMGTGTDVAMESAGVTLVGGDLAGILRARRVSALTMRNIRQNLFFAFIYNGLGVPIAAGALYPLLGWLLSPMLAAAAMSLSSVSVIGNALRLRGAQTSKGPVA